MTRQRAIFSNLTAIAIAGCAVYANEESTSPPTFTRDILPIFQEKCQECHRPGQVAPMSLLTHKEVRPWASSIRKEVTSRRMPPFYAAGPIGHWKDDLRLTDAEIQTIADWVNQGAPRGNPADKPPPREWPTSQWPFGEPDVVANFPAHDISTSGTDEYIHLFSDYVFPDDMWMSGVVLRAEQYDALHHVHIYVVPEQFDVPDDNKFLERQNVLAYPHIYTWFPGLTVELLPEGQGIPVTKGSRLALVVHFAPRTEPHEEVIRLGIHWANGKIERKRGVVRLVMPDINIPPNEPNYTYRKTATFEEDAWLTHFRAHMHLRGKSTQFTLHYPDGTSERVFDLPRYSFDWQRYYYLASPIHVPKDTELEIVATWDNSAGNPLNPNPSVPVRWGMNTADEMFGGSAHYVPVAKLANPVVVKNGIEADSQPPPK